MMKKPRKTSKQKDGARLNDEGRESPLDVLQLRMEYHSKLARDEIEKGVLGDPEKIEGHLKIAQEAAREIAPYRHARLQATEITADIRQTRYVARMPEPCKTIEEWAKNYPPEKFREEALKPIVEITVPKANPDLLLQGLPWHLRKPGNA